MPDRDPPFPNDRILDYATPQPRNSPVLIFILGAFTGFFLAFFFFLCIGLGMAFWARTAVPAPAPMWHTLHASPSSTVPTSTPEQVELGLSPVPTTAPSE